MNIAPRVAVFLVIVTASFTLIVQIENANQKLKSLMWLVPYLWMLCIFFLLAAIATAWFSKTDESRRQKRQDMVLDVLREHDSASTGDFMYHCPQLSQKQRDLALR